MLSLLPFTHTHNTYITYARLHICKTFTELHYSLMWPLNLMPLLIDTVGTMVPTIQGSMDSPSPLSEASVLEWDRHGPLSSLSIPPSPWRGGVHQDPHGIVHLLGERTFLVDTTQPRRLLSQHLVNKPLMTEKWG